MKGLLFVLESFRRHMDNGRWLFQIGMEAAGYKSAGGEIPPPGINETDIKKLVELNKPKVVVFWPSYEWDYREWCGPEVSAAHMFTNLEYLLSRKDILRVTVFHDAGSARESQKRWHERFQPHAFLTWYHDNAVMQFAPWVDGKTVRTFHVIDKDNVPLVRDRSGLCVVSGAFDDSVYPLRTACAKAASGGRLGPGTVYQKHPGYHQNGTTSYQYIDMLSKYRVAICTCSAYKFALRKIFEATAAGCRVITNLPEWDCLPEIDDNLIRVPDDCTIDELRETIQAAADYWDLDRQRYFADRCVLRYDYRTETARIASILEERYAALPR